MQRFMLFLIGTSLFVAEPVRTWTSKALPTQDNGSPNTAMVPFSGSPKKSLLPLFAKIATIPGMSNSFARKQ